MASIFATARDISANTMINSGRMNTLVNDVLEPVQAKDARAKAKERAEPKAREKEDAFSS